MEGCGAAQRWDSSAADDTKTPTYFQWSVQDFMLLFFAACMFCVCFPAAGRFDVVFERQRMKRREKKQDMRTTRERRQEVKDGLKGTHTYGSEIYT